MSEPQTLVKFFMGWVENGMGKDGLPIYADQLMVTKYVHPNTRLEFPATAQDIEDFPGPYALFQKEEKGRATTRADGYPLSMWPACREAEFKMLAARDIHTVEQLAGYAGRKGDPNMPAEIKELSERALKLITMQKDIGKFEAIIRDKDGQIDALQEQVEEALKTIATQKLLVDRLKLTTATV